MRLLHRLWHTQAICVPTRAQYANDTLSGIKHGKRWFARSPYLAEQSTKEAFGECEPDSGSTTASKGRSHQWRPTPEYEYVRKEGRRVSRKSRRQEIFGLTPRAKASTGTSLWITLTDFERLAKEGKATLEDADACLRYHRANIEALPFGKRRKACLELNTGRQVLYWVMGQQNGMPADVDDKRRFWNHGFCPNLMWHIIGEGLEEAIFDWIRIVSKQDTRSFALESNLLGSLGESQRLQFRRVASRSRGIDSFFFVDRGDHRLTGISERLPCLGAEWFSRLSLTMFQTSCGISTRSGNSRRCTHLCDGHWTYHLHNPRI